MRFQFGVAVLVLLPQACLAEPSCEQAAFAAVVSEAGATLASMNEENKRAFQAKLSALKTRESWADSDYAAKATPFVKDETTAALDEGNKTLLAKVPQLGGAPAGEPAEGQGLAAKRCAMLDELRTLMARVVENTRAKWAHMIGKLDAVLDVSRQAKAAGQ